MENKSDTSSYKIERLRKEWYEPTIVFLEGIFTKEQNIPKKLIPLEDDDQLWWCINRDDMILGTVAAWKVDSDWHWGRLAVDQSLRGLGIGKKLAIKSLDELFRLDIELVKIAARDITVDMILKLGGKVTGKKTSFYGHPITPMEIHKSSFILTNHS